jgi:hypothetical protein
VGKGEVAVDSLEASGGSVEPLDVSVGADVSGGAVVGAAVEGAPVELGPAVVELREVVDPAGGHGTGGFG